TTGLNWRDATFQCLESVLPRSGTRQNPEPSPPSPCFRAPVLAHRGWRARAHRNP
ncbi:hypothetical protein M9458_042097, partial [Cirrhinus mrigala]